jgi:hypothetical protein
VARKQSTNFTEAEVRLMDVLWEKGAATVTEVAEALRDHGVNPTFVQVAADLGYQFSPQELIDLWNHGVNEKYLRNLRASGMEGPIADEIVKLRTHGVG